MRISNDKIEVILAEKGMSLGALSERASVSRQSISTIKNRGTCRPETAAKIANGLGVDVSEIVKTED